MDLISGFGNRVLSVSVAVADLSGSMIVAASRTASLDDVLIAATARVHELKVATLNRRHFERLDVELVNL